jgi:methyl-accepting chemotaxis protein
MKLRNLLNPLQWNFAPRTIATLVTWAFAPLGVAGIVIWTSFTSGAAMAGVSPEHAQMMSASLVKNIAIVSLPLLIVCLLAAILFARVVVKPILLLRAGMERIAAGDLSQGPLPVKSRDEIGQMTARFNEMVASLQVMVRDVAGTAGELDAAGHRLQTVAGQAAQAADQSARQIELVSSTALEQTRHAEGGSQAADDLRAAAEQVSAAADSQAKEVEHVAVVVQQVASAIDQVAGSAGVVSDAAAKTRSAADDGGRSVAAVVSGMDRVRDKVLAAAGQVEHLSESLGQVDEILQLISEIADQTDMLALNAAIEAARVGEHGRGFAVVAGEVRRLAERSQRAANDIAERVGQLRGVAGEVVVTMEAGTQEVQNGTVLAQEAGASLDRILQAVAETQRQVESISAAAEEISAAGNQVVQATHHLTALAEENAATSTQLLGSTRSVAELVGAVELSAHSNQDSAAAMAAATEQVRVSVDDTVACATQVAGTSAKLREAVSRFRIDQA